MGGRTTPSWGLERYTGSILRASMTDREDGSAPSAWKVGQLGHFPDDLPRRLRVSMRNGHENREILEKLEMVLLLLAFSTPPCYNELEISGEYEPVF